ACGVDVDWHVYYENEKRNRIPMPTYYFKKQPYRLETGRTEMMATLQTEDERLLRKPNLTDWFYLPTWKTKLLVPIENGQNGQNEGNTEKETPQEPHRYLVFTEAEKPGAGTPAPKEKGVKTHLLRRLRKEAHIITVKAGDSYRQESDTAYTVNPAAAGDYEKLFRHLHETGTYPGQIIHMWNLNENTGKPAHLTAAKIAAAQDIGFYSLFNILKAMNKLKRTGGIKIDVLSSRMQKVMATDIVTPEISTLLGPVIGMAQEYPGLFCSSIDIEEPRDGEAPEEINELAEELYGEILYNNTDKNVAYRNGTRWVRDYEPLAQGSEKTPPAKLKQGGVYMITGGLGSAGYQLAKYLMTEFDAKVILLGRTPAEGEKQEKLQQLHDLQKGEALYYSSDIADADALETIVAEAETRFAPLNGVIHAAGLISGSSYNGIHLLEKADCEKQFKSKIHGVLAIAKVLENRKIDFCLLTSSVASMLVGPGYSAYAAANIFMDHYVASLRKNNRWISLNLDGLYFVGKEDAKIAPDMLAMNPKEFAAIFRRALAIKRAHQVVISIADLGARLDKWVNHPHTETLQQEEAAGEDTADTQHHLERPELSTQYVEPTTETEETLLGLWQTFFGIGKLGIIDDFFEIGGDSLKAMAICSKVAKHFNAEVPLNELFSGPTVKKMAAFVDGTLKVEHKDIEPVEEKEYYPMSSAQKRLYFLQQLDKKSTAYNIPQVLPLGKKVDRQKIEKILIKLIERHESLRTSFLQVDDEPYQRVHKTVEFKMSDYGVIGAGEERDVLALNARYLKPFTLEQPPLMRTGILRDAEGNHTWIVEVHHIVCDGTSLSLLTEDFAALYRGEEPENLRLQYKDYSAWQNRELEVGRIKEQEEYWLKLYSDEIPQLQIPADHKRPEIFTYEGAIYSFRFEREEMEKFRTLAADSGSTLYMNMLAALNTLFFKYSGQKDIIIGSGTAGRPHDDLQRIIGMFVNTLAMRNHPEGQKSYNQFLKEVAANSVRAFENQDVQFEELVSKLDLERDPSRNPLFDINMIVQNFRQAEVGEDIFPQDENDENQTQQDQTAQPDAAAGSEEKIVTSKFDMTFFVFEGEENIYVDIEYYTGIYKRETIKRMVNHFKEVVNLVSENPEIKLKEIDIMTEQEKRQVLVEFNRTEADYPADRTLYGLFQQQVQRTPENIAVELSQQEEPQRHEGRKAVKPDAQIWKEPLTYRQLDGRVNQLARYLLQEKGTRQGDRIGLAMDRSIQMVVSILAILKAGAAYVPMNPTQPEERLKYMINDAAIEVLVSDKKYIKILNRLQWECETLHSFICLDTTNIEAEEETETSDLMDERLWEHVGETATDEITGGGWVSSYTGELFTKTEMDEYGDNILKKIEPLVNKNMRVLEIGCASGITMFRIAPQVSLYYGTDLSSVIIEKDRQRAQEEGHQNIKLASLTAHEIDQIEEEQFDLIIINSVIHCFHGHNYLRKVIKKCINKLGQKGYLFIGDIMDQDKKTILETDMRNFKNANAGKENTTKTDFSAELFISREYWRDAAAQLGNIEDMQFSRKIHTVENELTRYRYDAIMTVDKTETAAEPVKKWKRLKWKRLKYRDDYATLARYGTEGFVTGETGSIDAHVNSTNPAYIIYTSGTTGKPKGVMVEQRGAVDYIRWAIKTYVGGERAAFPLFTSITFDLTVTSVFTPLLSGNEIVVYGEEEKGFILDTIIEDNKVGVIKLTPSHLKLIRDKVIDVETTKIKRLIVGGEELETELAEKITANFDGKIEIYNEYGPTETVVGSILHKYDPVQDTQRALPIGRPGDNTTIYILDEYGRPVPRGVRGEICIMGVGMARGYMNRPELTAERFAEAGRQLVLDNRSLPNNQSPITNNQLYHTGDLGSWRAEGLMEYWGRIDDQVKIRGYRVEMGEIEKRLAAHGEVKEVVVEARQREGGETYLCAYVVIGREKQPGDETVLPNELKEYLAFEMPDYMVPAYVVLIDKIPLTANGKVDRRALPEPGNAVSDKYIAPRNILEGRLAKIWAGVLGIPKEKIGVRDTFFELGGNSLNLVRMVSEVSRELVTEVSVARVYQAPVIEAMAGDIEGNTGRYAGDDYILLSKPAEEKVFFFPPGVAYGIVYNELAVLMPGVAIYSFNFIEEKDRLARYAEYIVGIQPQGPYRLFAWSASGALVFEIAAEMERRGLEVSDIIMADTFWGADIKKEYGEADERFIAEVGEGLKAMGAEFVREKVNRKIETYLRYKTGLTHLEVINSRVHLIRADAERDEAMLEKQVAEWQGFTTKPLKVYAGHGGHSDMFTPGPLQKNVKIIREILKQNQL
ncbi:MAG: SDR family NAD(P)-dependent oxidoreductase, partial [bacterium]|nr:SDR family NAD(P)-dependent oxidoreductase [bacterium]